MHKLIKPMRKKIESIYNIAKINGNKHKIGDFEPWIMRSGDLDIIIFITGKIHFKDDELMMTLRVKTKNDFKFDVILGASGAKTIEKNPTIGQREYIYYITFDYSTPNLITNISELINTTIS